MQGGGITRGGEAAGGVNPLAIAPVRSYAPFSAWTYASFLGKTFKTQTERAKPDMIEAVFVIQMSGCS